MPRPGCGSTGSSPWRRRAKAASADGAIAAMRFASSAVGGQLSRSPAPHTETAVRSASIGCACAGRSRSAAITAGGTFAGTSSASGCQPPVSSRSRTLAYVPLVTTSSMG